MLIVHLVKELLDLVINYKSIIKQIENADKLSFNVIEKRIGEVSNRIKNSDEWTLAFLGKKIQQRELDNRKRLLYKKKDIKDFEKERLELEKSLKEIEEKYWTTKWEKSNTRLKIKREHNLRMIFNPDKDVLHIKK